MFRQALLLLPLACLAAGAAHAADDPMVGNWKLNPQKSTMIEEMKVNGLGGNKYSFDLGGPSPEIIVADGTDQPGMFGTMLAVSADGSDQWTVVRKRDGRVGLRAIWTLSKDGNTLHDDYTEFRDNGKTTHAVYLFKRTGSGSGFSGDWVKSQLADSAYEVQVRLYEGDGLSIIVPTEGLTKNVKFDGKDYPNSGSKRNVVSSAQRENPRTIKLTDKLDEKVADTRDISVSEDGKILTMTVLAAGRSVPDVLVFERE